MSWLSRDQEELIDALCDSNGYVGYSEQRIASRMTSRDVGDAMKDFERERGGYLTYNDKCRLAEAARDDWSARW